MCPEIDKHFQCLQIIFDMDGNAIDYPTFSQLGKDVKFTRIKSEEYGVFHVYLQGHQPDGSPGITSHVLVDGKTCLSTVLRFAKSEAKTWIQIFTKTT